MVDTVQDVILIEDDPGQADWLADQIQLLGDFRLRWFDSEYSFLKAIEDQEIAAPAYAVIDLMLRYYSPRDLEALNSRQSLDPTICSKRGGLRSRETLLRVFPETKILLVTVLDDTEIGELPAGCVKVQKGDHELIELLEEFFTS